MKRIYYTFHYTFRGPHTWQKDRRSTHCTSRIPTKRNIMVGNGGYSSVRKLRHSFIRNLTADRERNSFSPQNAEADRNAVRRENRLSPMTSSQAAREPKTDPICTAGRRYGTLILRRNVTDFEKQIKVLEARISEYRTAVQEQIETRIQEIVDELLAALLERLKAAPPDHWHSRFLGKQPTDEDIKRLFREDVQGEVSQSRGRRNNNFRRSGLAADGGISVERLSSPRFRKRNQQQGDQTKPAFHRRTR